MAVLVHNRRQTDLLVVCLLPVVTGEVVRMMDCGAGSQVNNPCPVGFAFLLAEWRDEYYKFSYCL
jgi:hypothetical protein